jgi:hypothetical protein
MTFHDAMPAEWRKLSHRYPDATGWYRKFGDKGIRWVEREITRTHSRIHNEIMEKSYDNDET